MAESIATEIERIISEKLAEFARAKKTGMITVDVQVSFGEPTAINTSTKENRKVAEKRRL